MKKLLLISFLFSLFGVQAKAVYDQNMLAVITSFVDEKSFLAESAQDRWYVGEVVAVISQNPRIGATAFVEVESVKPKADGKGVELKMSLVRQSRSIFIQSGDFIKRMDLTAYNSDYVGTTDLLIRDSEQSISSKYRPLVHQGFIIGDTAQTLYHKEFLINYFGNLYYGITPKITVGTLAPVNLLGRPNFNFRTKLFESDSTTLSSGFSFVRLDKERQASLNWNIYWDNISSDALISHTFLSIGTISWENAEDAAALKYLSSSSFQTGYEVILDNWDRFLIGPSYNFEKKGLGGYLSYIWIADRVHIQISLNATDVTHLRLDPTDGYYGFFDMFWRF